MEVVRRRIFAVSDVHTDYPENWALLLELLSGEHFRHDVLLVAGDVSHERTKLRAMLQHVAGVFDMVFFVPGNHDLWSDRKAPAETEQTSLEKLHDILRLCAELGVETGPKEIHDNIVVVPLLSWHHQSFDKEPDVTHINLPTVAQVNVCRAAQPFYLFLCFLFFSFLLSFVRFAFTHSFFLLLSLCSCLLFHFFSV